MQGPTELHAVMQVWKQQLAAKVSLNLDPNARVGEGQPSVFTPSLPALLMFQLCKKTEDSPPTPKQLAGNYLFVPSALVVSILTASSQIKIEGEGMT